MSSTPHPTANPEVSVTATPAAAPTPAVMPPRAAHTDAHRERNSDSTTGTTEARRISPDPAHKATRRTQGYRLFLTYDPSECPEAPTRAGEQVAAWLRGKQYPDTSLDATAIRDLGPGHELAVAHHQGRHHADWRMRLEHPDARNPDITWRTTLTQHHPEQGQGWVLLTVENTGDIPTAPPALTQRLLDAIPLQSDGWHASNEATVIDTGQVDDLLEAITAPDRTGVFLVAGSTPDDADLVSGVRAVLTKATRKLRGLAHAIVLSPGATAEFAAAIGAEHAVAPWTVRVYLPDVDPAVPANQHRHKVVPTVRLYDEDALSRHLQRLVRPHHQTQALPREVASVSNDLDRVEDRALLSALTETRTPPAEAAPDTDPEAAPDTAQAPAPAEILIEDPGTPPTATDDLDLDLDDPTEAHHGAPDIRLPEDEFDEDPLPGTRDPSLFAIDPDLGFPRPWLSNRWRTSVARGCHSYYAFDGSKNEDSDTWKTWIAATFDYARTMRSLGYGVRRPTYPSKQRHLHIHKCPGCAWDTWSTDSDLPAILTRRAQPAYAAFHRHHAHPLAHTWASAALRHRVTRFQPLPESLTGPDLWPWLATPTDYYRARQRRAATPAPTEPSTSVRLAPAPETPAVAPPGVDDSALHGPTPVHDEATSAPTRTEVDTALVDRLARQINELRDRVDHIQADLDQARLDLEDARLEAREAHDDRRHAESVLRQLRADLTAEGWFERAHQDTTATDDLIPVPDSYEDLLTLFPSLEEHGIVLTSPERDAARNAEALDERDPLGDGAVIAWEALHALADYRRAKLNGDHTGNMESYIRNPPPGGYRSVPKGKFAGTETKATRKSFGDERTLPVPRSLHPDGEIVMTAHFRLGKAGGMSAPRMYYFDDTSRSGNIYVGYLGPHLRNTQT